MIQGSPEWFKARLGKVTASRVSDVVAKTKSGWGASRGNYAAELIAERLSGNPAPSFTSAAMQWGIDNEPYAKAAYEFHYETKIEDAGFVLHPNILEAGASPDGLVGADGLTEIKCPNTGTHIATLMGAPIDADYIKQMQWQMACTGRAWCDWVSFDPRMPEEMRLFVQRVERDDKLIGDLEREVEQFLAEIDAKVKALTEKYGTPQAMAA